MPLPIWGAQIVSATGKATPPWGREAQHRSLPAHLLVMCELGSPKCRVPTGGWTAGSSELAACLHLFTRPGPLLQEEAHSPVRGLLCLLADTPGSTAPAAMFGPQACCAPAAQLQELGGVLAGAVPSCHSCADPAAGGRGGLPQSRASGPGVLACPALLSGGPRAVCCPGS